MAAEEAGADGKVARSPGAKAPPTGQYPTFGVYMAKALLEAIRRQAHHLWEAGFWLASLAGLSLAVWQYYQMLSNADLG